MHGFVRVKGTITSFDISGSTYITPVAINDDGTVTGSYSTGFSHGFLRSADGTVTTFDPPDALNTDPRAINASGIIVGTYVTQKGDKQLSFIRDSYGTITTFAYGRQYTEATAINGHGRIAGTQGKHGDQVGFIASSDGSTHHTFLKGGVFPTAMNDHRAITGIVGRHGFVRFPD